MACSLKTAVNVSGLNKTILSSKTEGVSGLCSSFRVIEIGGSKPNKFPNLSVKFLGKPLVIISNENGSRDSHFKNSGNFSIQAQNSICVSRSLRWWEKTLKPNMVEIHSAQELVDSLLNAGDKLVIVDFYSPGCGGCKPLHRKISQLAETNPEAIFLKINYEELKTMCQSLHIHVLPFFRFYRGTDGLLCSFSCTNATIKKFKDAVKKHGEDRCSIGPAKGLDESEILALASAGELSIKLPLKFCEEKESVEDLMMKSIDLPGFWRKAGNNMDLEEAIA